MKEFISEDFLLFFFFSVTNIANNVPISGNERIIHLGYSGIVGDGLKIGVCVGVIVGDTFGDNVGVNEGIVVGSVVGVAVGVFVGLGEGDVGGSLTVTQITGGGFIK